MTDISGNSSHTSHFDIPDAEFEILFENYNLDPGLFTHEAHLRLAWIHIAKYGIKQAEKNICEQIKRFDKKFGDGTKFHLTLTIASVKIVYHFMQKSAAKNFEGFIAEFPRLKTGLRELITAHYKTNIFASEYARHNYIEPERIPFS